MVVKTNTVYAMGPNNSVIKRSWCSDLSCFNYFAGMSLLVGCT